MLARRPIVLGFLAAVVACSAMPEDSATPGANPTAGQPEAGLAQEATHGGPTTPPLAPTDWADTMEHLDARFQKIKAALAPTPPGDLAVVTRAATEGAALVRLGYGVHRDRKVDGFAQFARECESWLLRIAAEAQQGHGELAQDLFRGGEERHCTRCHEACDVVLW